MSDSGRLENESSEFSINSRIMIIAFLINGLISSSLAIFLTYGMGREDVGPIAALTQRAGYVTAPRAAPVDQPEAFQATDASGPAVNLIAPESLNFIAGQPISFEIEIAPSSAKQQTFILYLAGMPEASEFLGATQIGTDTWLLQPGSTNDLAFVFPATTDQDLEIAMELRALDGRTVAFAVTRFHPTEMDAGDRERIATNSEDMHAMRLARKSLARGDVVTARFILEKAAADGGSSSAYMLGTTYDSSQLSSLGIAGAIGNKERAIHWYKQAAALGSKEAAERLKVIGAE